MYQACQSLPRIPFNDTVERSQDARCTR